MSKLSQKRCNNRVSFKMWPTASVIFSIPWGFFLIQLNLFHPDPWQVIWDQFEANSLPLLAQNNLTPWMEHLIYTRVSTPRPGHPHNANQTRILAISHNSWLPEMPNSSTPQRVSGSTCQSVIYDNRNETVRNFRSLDINSKKMSTSLAFIECFLQTF